MPLYTFYPTQPDGLAPSFEAAELDSDAEAEVEAVRVLDGHRAAASVVVYSGDRMVHTRHRGAAADDLDLAAG